MRNLKRSGTWGWAATLAVAAAVALYACGKGEEGGRRGATVTGGAASAAVRTYVPPGDLDTHYLFYSGGHSGNVYVAGLPSMRHLATIPVFAVYPATGYGFDDESKKMLGGFTWGDVHHPSLSKTDGAYDGRWLFVNDNANARIARIDLRDFKTKQIFGPIPNLSGNHGSSFVTSNSEMILCASRFGVPVPSGSYAAIGEYAVKYKGVVGALGIDPKTGELSMGFEILTPPFDWDLGSTGRGPSADWAVWTCYNSERATGQLEKTASEHDRDYAILVNWREARKAAEAGKGGAVGGVAMLDPKKVPGLCYLLPVAKSPHGVDFSPDGTFFVTSGKLEAITTVYSFSRAMAAIQNKDFTGDEDGIPVLKYESVMEREVQIGLGPLHTQYDDKGNAYTSLFIDSAVAKWNPKTGEVLDTVPVSYNIGHLLVPGGDSTKPTGEYLIALNKLSHGRHLNVGPSQPESTQLIDISGEKMKLLYDAFTEPEPHYAQACLATLLHPIEVYPIAENRDPNAIFDVKDARVERSGNKVDVKMAAVRSTLWPTAIEVNRGDTVTIHLTNIEQTTDELHGLGINRYNINLVVDPGETKHVTFVADKPGVYPYYCTNFCSALHQEMQGYLLVKE
ncbi:MAG TPA: Sec-dependent nitrous-oxide reductase [Planctomycetota bacterium]|nr:Sec-dependent nitrous-oxide reductase [Planctomycetota bacterium]